MGDPPSDLAPPADAAPLCANQIDPGTHQPILLRAVDAHDLFYVAPYGLSAVMAVAKDGSSPPRKLAAIEGSSSGANAFDVAIDDAFAYYLDGGVWRLPKGGGTPVELAPPQKSSCGPYLPQRIALDPTRVWGTAEGGCTADDLRPIYFAIDKSTGSSLRGGWTIGTIIAADAGAACRAISTSIICFGADGTTWSDDVGAVVTALALDGTHAYVGTTSGVYDAEPDGTSALVASSAAKVTSVAARDGLVWFASDHIYRVDPTARNLTQLDARPASDIVVDSAFVYFQTVCNIACIPR